MVLYSNFRNFILQLLKYGKIQFHSFHEPPPILLKMKWIKMNHFDLGRTFVQIQSTSGVKPFGREPLSRQPFLKTIHWGFGVGHMRGKISSSSKKFSPVERWRHDYFVLCRGSRHHASSIGNKWTLVAKCVAIGPRMPLHPGGNIHHPLKTMNMRQLCSIHLEPCCSGSCPKNPNIRPSRRHQTCQPNLVPILACEWRIWAVKNVRFVWIGPKTWPSCAATGLVKRAPPSSQDATSAVRIST